MSSLDILRDKLRHLPASERERIVQAKLDEDAAHAKAIDEFANSATISQPSYDDGRRNVATGALLAARRSLHHLSGDLTRACVMHPEVGRDAIAEVRARCDEIEAKYLATAAVAETPRRAKR